MKKYLIFDLDGTLIQSDKQISEIIYKYIAEKIDVELIDKARYIIENNQWMSIYEWLTILLDWNIKSAQIHTDNIYSLINSIEDNVDFFTWVKEKIIELSQTYILFLSTGNSDIFANDILKKWWIHKCFHKILWSTNILKSHLHINEFINYIWDENFSENTIFIGDGQRDREIAEFANIVFIHIWSDKKDKYEIKCVSEIDEILNDINKIWWKQ